MHDVLWSLNDLVRLSALAKQPLNTTVKSHTRLTSPTASPSTPGSYVRLNNTGSSPVFCRDFPWQINDDDDDDDDDDDEIRKFSLPWQQGSVSVLHRTGVTTL